MALEDDFKFEDIRLIVPPRAEGLEKAFDLDLDIFILDLMLPGERLEICKS